MGIERCTNLTSTAISANVLDPAHTSAMPATLFLTGIAAMSPILAAIVCDCGLLLWAAQHPIAIQSLILRGSRWWCRLEAHKVHTKAGPVTGWLGAVRPPSLDPIPLYLPVTAFDDEAVVE